MVTGSAVRRLFCRTTSIVHANRSLHLDYSIGLDIRCGKLCGRPRRIDVNRAITTIESSRALACAVLEEVRRKRRRLVSANNEAEAALLCNPRRKSSVRVMSISSSARAST